MAEGAEFQKDYVALAETHNSPIPTLHLQRDFPFTVNTAKMGKSGKKNFYLWEKCVISSLWSVGFLGYVGESTITWRDKVVEMGLLALWSPLLLCCPRSWPPPEHPCYCSSTADLGRDAFWKFTCYLHFPYLRRSFPCFDLAHDSLQAVPHISFNGSLSGEFLVEKMSKILHPD